MLLGQVLSVIDVNEAPVVFDQSYALDVATPIRVSIAAFDPDSGFKPQFSKLNYSVLQSNDTNGYFLLDPVSGVFTGPPLNLDLDSTKNAFYFQVKGLAALLLRGLNAAILRAFVCVRISLSCPFCL